jgi:Protein of unknown function (DUF2950)
LKSVFGNGILFRIIWIPGIIVSLFLFAAVFLVAQQSKINKTAATTEGVQSFKDPQEAAAALIDAADKFNVPALIRIFGPQNEELVMTGEYPLDRQRAADFAAQAHEKNSVSLEPRNGNRAFLLVGDENWPFPVPIVKRGDRWFFDAKVGRRELLYRRVGYNELAAIDACRGYVQAQEDFAYQKRQGYEVHQYAQRIISSPGKQDGLAWKNSDGSWGGPLAEGVARAIDEGYTGDVEPYHGYFFKILKGQGSAAPLGELNFVVEGVMIGGFALVAAPAEYGETGMKTFIVGYDGVVYQKDLGPASFSEFQKMELYNPDKSWTPVREED